MTAEDTEQGGNRLQTVPNDFMRISLFTLLMLAASRSAFACPVCFGQSDSPLAWGVNMGVFLMLAVTGGVLAAFATFFIHLMRRARLAEQMPYAVSGFGRTTAGLPEGRHHVRAAQEGTS